jgi:hypothetical protein
MEFVDMTERRWATRDRTQWNGQTYNATAVD